MARQFRHSRAEREKLKFSGMYMGATGSGKTLGALLTAKGLVKANHPKLDDTSDEFWAKIGVVDTEHNRSKVYANIDVSANYIGKFVHVEFEPPYDVDGYLGAVDYLKALGCEVIIVDSVTHAWDDSGGILDVYTNMGGQFSTWQKLNPLIKKLYHALTADQDVHIITTVRSKIKYEAAQTETGKMKVSKIGLKPIMRDDFEYEVLTALHFDEDHKVSVVKDNTHIFENDVLLTPEYGKLLHEYLDQGVDINAKRKEKLDSMVSIIANLLEANAHNKELTALMLLVEQQAKKKYGVVSWKELPMSSLDGVLTKMKEVLKLND
jgi:hypothetical protein